MAESTPTAIGRPGLLVGLAVLLVFGPLVGAEYVWDDDALIVQNTALTGWQGVVAAWTGGLWDHTPQAQTPPIYYRPVMLWSLSVDALLGGGPRVAHVHTLAWHLLNVWLVAVVARRLECGVVPSWTAAAVFGLHPVAVESVAWTSARNDSLAVAAVLSALALALGAGRGGKLLLIGGLAAFGAAAKETAYLAPLYVVLPLWAMRRPVWRAGLAASAGVGSVLLCRWLAGVAWPPGADAAHMWASAWPTAAWAVDSLVVPSVRAPGAHLAWPEPVPVWGMVAGIVGLVVVAWGGRRRGLAMVALACLGALPAWPAVAHVGLFGDRYLLLPLATCTLAVGAALDRFAPRGPSRPRVWILLVLPYAIAASASVATWQDDVALWSASVESHENPHTAGSLAKVLELEGDLSGAARWYAVATAPPRPLQHACWNVAALEVKRGLPERAADAGVRALQAGCPPDPELVCPTSYGLAASGQWDAAGRLLATLESGGTGLCTITELAGSARRRDGLALESAVGDAPGRWMELAERLGRLLRAGGDLETAAWVDAHARERQGRTGG